MNTSILVVDDDDAHRGMLRMMLQAWGYSVDEAADGDLAVEAVRAKPYDVVLTDVRMGRMDGIHALRGILDYNPALPVVLMTAYSSVETAVDALRLGAYDYLTKPLDFDALRETLQRAVDHSRMSVENRELRRQLSEAAAGPEILGRSLAVSAMREIIATVAPTEATVLITGESGTGKELVARAVHGASARANKPLVTVNCAALAENLLESELFGHERGAFTGADRRREGRFLQADGGTLFLDEIGEMPLSLQAKLLRALQQGESSPPPTATCAKRWSRSASARTCSSASTSSASRCPPCVNAARTSPCWRPISWKNSRPATARTSRASPRRPWTCCAAIPGPATCASSRTPWNAP